MVLIRRTCLAALAITLAIALAGLGGNSLTAAPQGPPQGPPQKRNSLRLFLIYKIQL